MERQGRMKFDEKRYLEEMRDLIDRAIAVFEARPEKPVVYTVSIWTDPDAAASAVCIDTEVNSQRFVAGVNEYNRVKREQFLADGDEKMAKLFGVATRNCSPADFAFRDLVECDHESFPPDWNEETDGQCWQLLGPALQRVAEIARSRFSRLRHHPDAILGINSARDWFDQTFKLR